MSAKRTFEEVGGFGGRVGQDAMVQGEQFGGFNMSGTDSKAGGPDYLLLFTQAKSVAEKLGGVETREEEGRGFSGELFHLDCDANE